MMRRLITILLTASGLPSVPGSASSISDGQVSGGTMRIKKSFVLSPLDDTPRRGKKLKDGRILLKLDCCHLPQVFSSPAFHNCRRYQSNSSFSTAEVAECRWWLTALHSKEFAKEMHNVNDQRRLPLEEKLSTKETDEVFMAAIISWQSTSSVAARHLPLQGKAHEVHGTIASCQVQLLLRKEKNET